MKIIQIFLYAVIIAQCAYGQIQFDSDFENGNVDFYHVSNDTVELPKSPYLHVRLTGATSGNYHYFIDQGPTGFSHRYNHRMVYRYAGDTVWHQMDTGYVDTTNLYHFYNHEAFAEDTVYLAYWYPYTFTQVEAYLSRIADNYYVSNLGVRDTSYFGRNIYGYCITDPDVPNALKRKVIIQCRQHAFESLASIVSDGLSDFLLFSSDEISAELKKRAIFYFYPMMNPDGVVEGGNPIGQPDHNDEWFESCSSQGGVVSANFEIEKMRNIIWNDCNGHADYAFDIHSHPGHTGRYYWWSLVDTNSMFGITQEMCDTSLLLISRINYHDGNDNADGAIISSSSNDFVGFPSNLTAPPADWWLNQTMGAISYTLEPGSAPTRDYYRIKKVGVSLAKGLYDVLPPVFVGTRAEEEVQDGVRIYPNPTNGALHITGEALTHITIIQANGRLVMDRPVNGVDATIDMHHFAKGVYFVRGIVGAKQFVRKVIVQ